MSRVLRFEESGLVAAHDPLELDASPDLADSFLARRATVRNFTAHRRRFEEGLRALAPARLNQLEDFYRSVALELAEETESFPRLDLVNGALWLRVRPLPLLNKSVEATSAELHVENEDVKGPNIARYTSVNQANAGETIRVDTDGYVLEGASSALVWWDNAESTLHVVGAENRIWSTTESFLVAAAQERGIQIAQSRIRLHALSQHEVWAVNGLHGIRVITSLDGNALPPPNQHRLDDFSATFDASWQPISSSDQIL